MKALSRLFYRPVIVVSDLELPDIDVDIVQVVNEVHGLINNVNIPAPNQHYQ